MIKSFKSRVKANSSELGLALKNTRRRAAMKSAQAKSSPSELVPTVVMERPCFDHVDFK